VESRDLKEVQNEYILRLVCFQSVVRASCSRPRRQRDRAAVAPARGPTVRYISARAALHAWPRPKMAREARAERKLIESSGISSEVETVAEPWTGPRPMISTQPSSAFLANRDGQADFSTLVGSDQLQPGCRRVGNGPWHIGVYVDFGKHNWGHRGRCAEFDRCCSLIPGFDVKLSTTFLAGPTVLSAVGSCPPHKLYVGRRTPAVPVQCAGRARTSHPTGRWPRGSRRHRSAH
jgi:hypothetical protein